MIPTPPSSLDMDRRGSAARTGRAEIAATGREHHGIESGADRPAMSTSTRDDAYFSGEKRRAATIPTPDQDIVDDIGKALGVEYADNEELKGADKVDERDKHRWELTRPRPRTTRRAREAAEVTGKVGLR